MTSDNIALRQWSLRSIGLPEALSVKWIHQTTLHWLSPSGSGLMILKP
ncbi:hypothetical protein [Paenibacillus glacialis]|nr:hypothetical protein [Paenibacillus glacialis]